MFNPQNENLKVEYEKGISLRDIFLESSVGVVTSKDDKVIAFNETDLEKSIKEHFSNFDSTKVTTLLYRPFDFRKIYYDVDTKGIIGRGRKKIMQHFINKENIGLVVCRSATGQEFWSECTITECISEFRLIGLTGANNYPLYLYQTTMGVEEKVVNFKPQFSSIIKQKFGEVIPEQVLGYIYAVLHSKQYRTKYLDFLKIDFPKIPFDVEKGEFNRLSKLGQELINLHLMKLSPNISIGEPETSNNENINYKMEKVIFSESTKRLYFNETSYFANVPTEVYNFKVGGYLVLDKYLKARKNIDIREDLEHIQNIIKVLASTIEVMQKIDAIL